MSQQHSGERDMPGPARPAPPPDASMWLLHQVMDHTLDEGYEEAAARRAAEGRTGVPRPLRARLWLAGGLALAALIFTLGAAQTRVAAPSVAKEREELTERIEAGTAQLDRLQEEVDELGAAVEERQREALRLEGGGSDLVALLAGATAVEGPGLELVIDDAEGAGQGLGGGPRDGGGFSDTGRVRDRDLQRVVNGLWQAGAEALAVNGQRLTSVSAIRAAGDAVLVDNRPLVPPYTLLAVGDGQALRAGFENTADGLYLGVLQDNYGVRVASSVKDKVHIPAAPSLTLRSAAPVEEPAETGQGNAS
ncbi:DUF881 domain-containing protein [Streptomyces sodiiphilus]